MVCRADFEGLAQCLNCLADPNCLQIVALLRHHEHSLSEIQLALNGLAQAQLLQYLSQLVSHGLVQSFVDGACEGYRIASAEMAQVVDLALRCLQGGGVAGRT